MHFYKLIITTDITCLAIIYLHIDDKKREASMCKQVIYGKYQIRIIKFLSNFLGTRT